jgi:hypothetical protein
MECSHQPKAKQRLATQQAIMFLVKTVSCSHSKIKSKNITGLYFRSIVENTENKTLLFKG